MNTLLSHCPFISVNYLGVCPFLILFNYTSFRAGGLKLLGVAILLRLQNQIDHFNLFCVERPFARPFPARRRSIGGGMIRSGCVRRLLNYFSRGQGARRRIYES